MNRNRKRAQVYKLVKKYANSVQKPLMVIGDPYNGIGSKFKGKAAYGCGDVCIDLTGCPNCKGNINIKGAIPKVLESFDTNSVVVFVSYVLEYVDDYKGSITSLKRVGGDNVFALTVSPWCFTSYLYPGRNRTIWENPFPYVSLV